MKAAVYYENGGPEVLRYEDVADPACGPRNVVIKVAAVSIEGGDTLNRFGGPLVTRPHIVGYQASGTVVQVGSEVTTHKLGDRVATVNGWGSHAELREVPARNAWAVPDGLDLAAASIIPVTFGTAHECLFDAGQLKAGDTVLVQAGASGVGIAAIQLAKAAGVGEKVAAITERAMRGELDFQASFRERMALLKGLPESTLAEIAETLRLTEGAETLISQLRRLGYKTAILSGGFTYFAERLQKRLGIDYVYANTLPIKDGVVTGDVQLPIVDGQRKADLLRELAQREGISLEQTKIGRAHV